MKKQNLILTALSVLMASVLGLSACQSRDLEALNGAKKPDDTAARAAEIDFNCKQDSGPSCLAERCEQAGGRFNSTLLRCDCASVNHVFLMTYRNVGECAWLSLWRTPVDRVSPLNSYQVVGIDGIPGAIEFTALNGGPIPEHYSRGDANDDPSIDTYVPGLRTAVRRGEIFMSDHFYAYGRPVYESDAQLIGYESSDAYFGVSFGVGGFYLRPLTPIGLNKFAQRLFELVADHAYEMTKPFPTDARTKREGDCQEFLNGCKLTEKLVEVTVNKIGYEIRREAEFSGGVRVHHRVAIYRQDRPNNVVAIVTQSPSGVTGLVGLGPETGIDVISAGQLPHFRFYDSNGREISRRETR